MRLATLLVLSLTALAGGAPMTVTLKPSDALLANPGMGWQTFHRFADEDKNLGGLPSGSAYFRFYWREAEPKDGEIDFAKFDDLLARAHRAGQKLAFRIMCTGSGAPMDVPKWLKDSGCPGFEFKYEGKTCWVPDMNSPQFLEPHLRLIRELGRRYDAHPDLDVVDLGSVGLWGEWHMSGTGVAMPSEETCKRIVHAWLEAFPHQPTVGLIGYLPTLREAVAAGAGWRADCLGDMGGFSKTWNHMNNLYRQQVAAANAGEAWRRGPVAFESCWDMRKWVAEGWDVRHIFDYALDLHCSYLNNKSAPIPEGTRPEIERLLRRLGYRLVLRTVSGEDTLKPGTPLTLALGWTNEGVAPPYRDDRVALRLTGAKTVVLPTSASIRGMQPGDCRLDATAAVPADLPAGKYALALAVVAPGSTEPAVRLANEGRGDDGWYALGEVTVGR